MIRAIAVILGLALGLCLAALSGGRLGHLRSYYPQTVPGWAAPVHDDAGLLAGHAAEVPVGPFLADLDWRLAGAGPSGLGWRLGVTAPGTALALDLRWSFAGGNFEIAGGTGEADLAAAFALPLAGLSGRVVLERIAGRVDPDATRFETLAMAGRVEGVRLEGTLLGDGRFTLADDGAGGWRAELTLDGQVVALAAEASGDLGATPVRVGAKLAPGPDFPVSWLPLLQVMAQPSEGSWVWEAGADLGALRR